MTRYIDNNFNNKHDIAAKRRDEDLFSAPEKENNYFDNLKASQGKAMPAKESSKALFDFESFIGGAERTSDEINEAYLRSSRQISINAPDAWSELDNAYTNALSNAFTPDTSMDSQSRNAISNFKSSVHSNMTADEMKELFTRFSREVSIKFPEAWNELDTILSNSLPKAYRPDTSMDSQSRNAIDNFRGAINSGMTADEMNETFLRFSREVSVKFPEALKELDSILSDNVSNSRVIDTTMDSQSRNAISNFKSTINENFSKDEMVEMFLRFSREVSVKFPDAWKELESILNQNTPNAFKENTSSDASSEQAVINFKGSILESHSKDDLTEMFLRFSRDISIKYPDKKNELISIFNNAVPNAFVEDTTIDNDSVQLVDEFKTIIQTQDVEQDTFSNLFANYFNQISLKLTKARSMMNNLKNSNFKEAEKKTEGIVHEAQSAGKLKTTFKRLVNDVNGLDYELQNASDDLKGSFNKDDQKVKKEEIEGLEAIRSGKDNNYNSLMAEILGNDYAKGNVNDDYNYNITIDKVAPGKDQIVNRNNNKLTEYDMLRTMRRDEIKGLISDIPKEAMTEILYNVPKYQLINGLTLLPHEQQVKALTTNRDADALLREMPTKQLIEELPDAYEMLPMLMMMGKTESGFNNGAELIEDSLVNDFKTPEQTNDTREQEDLLPFMKELLSSKSPRMADANNPSLGMKSPVTKTIDNIQAKDNNNIDLNNENKFKSNKIEDLSTDQLLELARETISNLNEDELTSAKAVQRGGSKEMMNFLKDLKKVDSFDAGKMAMSNLYNSQAQNLKSTVIPRMSNKELLKVNKLYGKDPKEMVKRLPQFVVSKQLHELSKIQVVESYKNVGEDMIMSRLQSLPSQVLARSASQIVDRDTIIAKRANNEGLTA